MQGLEPEKFRHVCVEYAKLVHSKREKENECYLGDANFVLHALT